MSWMIKFRKAKNSCWRKSIKESTWKQQKMKVVYRKETIEKQFVNWKNKSTRGQCLKAIEGKADKTPPYGFD